MLNVKTRYILSDYTEDIRNYFSVYNNKKIYPIYLYNRYIIRDNYILDTFNIDNNIYNIFYNIYLYNFIFEYINSFKKEYKLIIYNLDNNLFKTVDNYNSLNISLNKLKNNLLNSTIKNNSILNYNNYVYYLDSYYKYNNILNITLEESLNIKKDSIVIISSYIEDSMILNIHSDYTTNVLGVFIEYKDNMDLFDLTNIYQECFNSITNMGFDYIFNNKPMSIEHSRYSVIIDTEYKNIYNYINNFFIKNLTNIYNDVIDVLSSYIELNSGEYNITNMEYLNNSYIVLRLTVNDSNIKLINNILTYKNLILFNPPLDIKIFDVVGYRYSGGGIDIELSHRFFEDRSYNFRFIDNSTLVSFQPPISFIPIVKNLGIKHLTMEYLFEFLV